MSKQSLDLIQEKINELEDMSGDICNMAQANWNACRNIRYRLNDIQTSLSQIENMLKNIDDTLYLGSLD